MQNFIQACLKANKELYCYILTKLTADDLKYRDGRGHGGDRSSNIDMMAENIFKKHLLKYGDIYSEESGLIRSQSESAAKGKRIILDPIDGSDNLLSNLPYYGSSAALEIEGEVKAAVVCNLVSGELFIKDEYGLIVNNLNKCRTTAAPVSSEPKIALFERSYKYPDICSKLYDEGIKYRSPGAVALSLANARNYRFVLFGGAMREFDLKAALYICSDLHIYKNDEFLLVSKNQKDFDKIKEIINIF
jgi:myo-inositol-1(or 4)-monophosphatase